jgi:regulator of protease activity HflC (stomatin/prohibitin superfamily)
MKTKIVAKGFLNAISVTVLVLLLSITGALFYYQVIGGAMLVAGIVTSILLASSIQIADQWEKAVVLRMGKYRGLKGPGIFLIIPILERVMNYIDQRIRVSDFKAEQTLTKDTVPVNVVAVL